MSTNGINVCEDAEMADCDGDKVVTMMDVLKEQEDFEEDANAVLGASDDINCTYSKGYIKRQAIYACMTCTDAKSDHTKRAGVCLACSLTCHENHELIELYTKRNFRCDCGNPKFNSHPCQFTPDKTDLNTENIYNQNFSGVYCTCHRPYPDPESNIEGDMIQCIICEDWLHCNHLDAVVPPNEQYSEMICKACMDKNEFLHDYSDFTVNKENMDVDVLNTSSENISISNCNEESTTELINNEHNGNSNSDATVNAKTESANVEKENEEKDNEDETKKVEESTSKSDLTEEKDSRMEEQTIDNSESNIPPSDSLENSSEINVSKLETNQETETEHSNKIQPETKTSEDTINDNPIENKDSIEDVEAAPKVDAETPDNRSQEQVEEDLLLADPTDTELKQKEEIANVTSSSVIQSSTEAVTDEKKSHPEAMDTSESVNEDQVEKTENKNDVVDESKSNNVTTTKQSSEATAEESEIIVPASESQSVITPEQTETDTVNELKEVSRTEQLEDDNTAKESSEQTEKAAITENSEGVLAEDQSETVSTSEQKESVLNSVVTDNQEVDQHDKNDDAEDVSANKSSTVSEENKSDIRENSTDTPMVENTTDEAVINNIQNDEIVNNSTCNDSKTTEIDILKRKLSADVDTGNVEVKKLKLEINNCVRPKEVKKVHHGATFWPSNFRHKLCTCNECLSMYKDLSVLFLIDPEDTVTAYERLGKEKTDGKPASQYEKGMAALSSLGRVQQINALTEYTKLRDKLVDFLKTFKDNKAIVKEEDIKAFFAGMKAVREPDGVYFCR